MSRNLRFLFLLLAVAAVFSWSAHAEEEAKTFFLPKNPTAAAYILGRLSNKELIEAPRSEFVHVALLQRKGLDRKYRVEALEGLAKIRKTDPLTELLAGLEALDKKGEDSAAVLRDLAPVLLQSKPEELATKRSALEKIASVSQLPLTRQIGFAAIVVADNSIEPIWRQAQPVSQQLVDLIRSIEWIRNPTLRAAFYAKAEPLIHHADSAEVQRSAIAAVSAISGHEAETFSSLAALVKAGTERAAAVAGLQTIARKFWQKGEAESLIESLFTYLKSVPVEQRTEAGVIRAFQLATDLTALLPTAKAGVLGKELRALGVSVFSIRTISEQMLYDRTLIVVEAGKAAEIILINEDAMPHNLVIVSPGALEEIGMAAEKMSPDLDEQGRLYVPQSSKVLFATKLVEPGQQVKLSFTAPEQPGDYPYVCTFPGHWRRMVGTLAVVKDVEAYLSSRIGVVEPKVTEWKVDDFALDMSKVSSGRNLARGKELFTRLACAGCHRLGKEGINYGPDLNDVLSRFKNDRADILRQIIEPSLVISNRYRNIQMELKDGATVRGMILKEDGTSVTLQTGPSDALIQRLAKSEIKDRRPQSSSPMPVGLLNTLSKEQILDLMAWLEFGISPSHQHQH